MFNGTFSLPYANVTQQIGVWYDEEAKKEKISYFNETDYTIWNLNEKKFFDVITMKPNKETESKQMCSTKAQEGTDPNNLLVILPDISSEGWKQMPDTKIMKTDVKHFRLLVVNGDDQEKIKDDSSFVYKRYD